MTNKTSESKSPQRIDRIRRFFSEDGISFAGALIFALAALAIYFVVVSYHVHG